MRIYRRRKHTKSWHFMPSCQFWIKPPTIERYEEQTKEPPLWLLCGQCTNREKREKAPLKP